MISTQCVSDDFILFDKGCYEFGGSCYSSCPLNTNPGLVGNEDELRCVVKDCKDRIPDLNSSEVSNPCRLPEDDVECFFIEKVSKCFTGNCSDYNNDYLNSCGVLDVCVVEADECIVNPCGTSLPNEDGICNYPCILEVDGWVCMVDPCVGYDEVSCRNSFSNLCHFNKSHNSCQTYRCPDLDLR
jgi:hypothetical protein